MSTIKIRAFVKRGGIWFLGATVFSKFSNVIITVILARLLDVSTFGELAQFISLSAILIPVISLSSQEVYIYFANRVDCRYQEKIVLLKSLLVLIIVLFAIAMILTFIYFLVGGALDSKFFTFLIYASLFSCSSLALSYFRVIGFNKTYSLFFTLQNGFLLYFIVVFIIFDLPIELSWPLSALVFFLLVFNKSLSKRSKTIFKATSFKLPQKRFLTYGISITIGVFASVATFHLDTIMVGWLIGDSEAGYYKVMSMLPVLMLFIPSGYLGSDFKYLVSISNKPDEVRSYYLHFVKLFLPISLVLATGIYFLTNYLVLFLLGELPNYVNDTKIYFALSIIVTFVFRTPIGNIFNAMGMATFNVKVSIIVLLFNVSLNFVLINQIGVVGAALASLLSFLIGALISSYYLYLYLKKV